MSQEIPQEPLFEHIYIAFYTATILEWKHLLKPDKYKQIIIDSFAFLAKEKRVKVYGFVVMNNHIHLLWKIVPPYTLKEVQLSFMKYTAQMIKFDLQKHHTQVLEKFYVGAKDRQYQFWERNPLTIYLYERKAVEQKLDYIHHNPVSKNWNLVSDWLDYPFSSARFYEQDSREFGFLTHYMDEF
jgi:REP element-mobilizing transposase RayT